ncbi:unnamed protein product [Rotaria sp. Silwood1]|nr:unnamed protein product [Rotaria sp. Silwood1]
MVRSHVETSLGRQVPLRTIQRYGKELGIRSRKTHEVTSRNVDDEYWYEIANFQKFLQRIPNYRLIFLDETAIYATMFPNRTLVAPGHESFIIVDKPSAYADRYDFIGVINGVQPIAYMTLTPVDRKSRNMNGVRMGVVNEWITKELAPAINRLCINDLYLICDKS